MASEPHTLLMFFDAEHRTYREGWPAPLVRGRDHKLAKDTLDVYTMEQSQALVTHFFVMSDEWIDGAGYGFNIFRACLPKVLASYQRQQKVSAKQQMIRDRSAQDIQQIAEWREMSPQERAQRLQDDRDAVKRQIR